MLAVLFVVIAIYLLVAYWFFPFRVTEFVSGPSHSNFSLNSTGLVEMQFYENMRFTSSDISYQISDCTLDKQNEMEQAFDIIENVTILNFFPVSSNEDISVTCSSGSKIKGGLFIGGEGGPTNITKTDTFSVVKHGNILLIRPTNCKDPIIPTHELLHVLGFNHSSNKNNIMYPVIKCYQTVGEEIPNLLNELYSYPSYPDLAYDNVSASMEGRFLDLNITIRNQGLINSNPAIVKVFADDEEIKQLTLDALEVGAGRMLILKNSFVSKLNFDSIRILIEYEYDELRKNNNEYSLQIKK